MPPAENDLERYRKRSRFVEERLPTMEEVDRAIEQPAEADPLVVTYLQTHPELVEKIRSLRAGMKDV
jgi:hypothetical protein